MCLVGLIKKIAARTKRRIRFMRRKISFEISAGDPSAPQTLRQYVKTWLAERQHTRRAWKDDAQRLRDYIMPALGDLMIADITTMQIRQTLAALERAEPPLAPRTILHTYAALRSVMSTAAADGVVKISPAAIPRHLLPRNEDRDPGFRARVQISASEVQTLIKNAPQTQAPLFAVLAYTGLRISEAAGLNWGDLNREAQPIPALFVGRQFDSKTGQLRPTKTRTEKWVPVHPELALILHRWRSQYAFTAGQMPTGEAPMLANAHGKRWRADTAARAIARQCTKQGIPRHTCHDFRRFFMSHLFELGARREVIESMTHTQRGVFFSYTSITYKSAAQAVQLMRLEQKQTKNTK